MNKFSKLFAIFAILFLLMGVTGCVVNVGPDTTPPSNVKTVSHEFSQNANDTNKADIKFTWTNPSEIDYAKVEIWCNNILQVTANYPDTYYTIRSLTKGRSYTFVFKSKDYTGNTSSGLEYTVTVPTTFTPTPTPTPTPTTTIAEISTAAQLKSFFTNTTAAGKLTADITITEQLKLGPGTAKTLDLNGKKITCTQIGSYEISVIYVSSGDLTIKDSTKTATSAGNGAIISDAANAIPVYVTKAINSTVGGKLTVNGGKILTNRDGISAAVYIGDNCTAEITDGEFKAIYEDGVVIGDAIRICGTADIKGGTFWGIKAIHVYSGGRVTRISGVRTDASVAAIYNMGTIDSISGENLLASGGSDDEYVYALYNGINAVITSITGGQFSATGNNTNGRTYAFYNAGTVTLYGGTFTVSGVGTLRANWTTGTTNNVNNAATFTNANTN